MPELWTYDYAVIRVVPRVERGEFINVGVIVSSEAGCFLEAQIELDEARLLALDANAELTVLREGLEAIPRMCASGDAAGQLKSMTLRERFRWLVAPRSTCIQVSPMHTGQSSDLHKTVERLMRRMVRSSAGL